LAACLYVDGLSLYYSSIRGTAYRWLNLEELADALALDHKIIRIHYFATAEPHPAGHSRQIVYLRALRTLRRVKVHEVTGTHAVSELTQRLLEDDKKRRYDLVAILANDGRLASPISGLRTKSCIILPYKRKLTDPSLPFAASFNKKVSRSALETSLLPDPVMDKAGHAIAKPVQW
jgi:hypothetical protein